jgi:hypothetical protein
MRGVRVSRADRAEYGRASSGPPPISRAIVEVDVHDALDEDRPPHNRIPQAARTAGLLDLLTNRAGRPTSNDPADVMREDIGRSPVGGERQSPDDGKAVCCHSMSPTVASRGFKRSMTSSAFEARIAVRLQPLRRQSCCRALAS